MLRKFVLVSLLSLCYFSPLSATAGVSKWIQFKLEGGHIKVPVTVAGIDTYAILDTGAQVNAINKAFIGKHNLSLKKGGTTLIKGAFGIREHQTYDNIEFQFFGIETQLNDTPELFLGNHKNGMILGGGFFSKFIVQLDYPNEKMRLMTRDAIDLDKHNNIELRLQKGSSMPIVKVGLPEERSIWLLFDTGNSGGIVIKRSIAKHMDWLSTLEVDESYAFGVNKMVGTENFRVPWIRFGPFEMENILVTVPAEGQHSNLESQFSTTGTRIRGKKVRGLIGYDVLKHFVITLDYKTGKGHVSLPQT